MLRYLADEDFDNRILRAFRRRAVDELIFLAKESMSDEWEGQVVWLPL